MLGEENRGLLTNHSGSGHTFRAHPSHPDLLLRVEKHLTKESTAVALIFVIRQVERQGLILPLQVIKITILGQIINFRN